VGPVAVAIVPRSAGAVSLNPNLGQEGLTVAKLMKTGYARLTPPVGGELPAMRCKYTLPVTDDDYNQFVDPFPVAKYRKENPNSEEEQLHDETWRQYGMLLACSDKIFPNIECYVIKTRILVEFRGVRDVYIDAQYVSDTDQEPRRLSEDFRNPSTALREGYNNNDVILTNSDGTTDMTAVTNLSASVATHNVRISALEKLSAQLKVHQGVAAVTTHIAAGQPASSTLDQRTLDLSAAQTALTGRVDANEAAITQLQPTGTVLERDGNHKVYVPSGFEIVVQSEETVGGFTNVVNTEYTRS
jgi:hypothetical protein